MTRFLIAFTAAAALTSAAGLAHAQNPRLTNSVMGTPTSPLTGADIKSYEVCRGMTYAQITANKICQALIAHHPELKPVAPAPTPVPPKSPATPKPK